MKKLGGHRIFSWEIGGSPKKSRDYWVATNFNENFVQWNSSKMYIFRATRIGGYIYFFNIVAPDEGVIKFLISKGGSQKYCRGIFGNSWPPYSKENGGPLFFHEKLQKWLSGYKFYRTGFSWPTKKPWLVIILFFRDYKYYLITY